MTASSAALPLPHGWPGVALTIVIVLVAFRLFRRGVRARREQDMEWQRIKDKGSGTGADGSGPRRTSP